MNRKWPRNLSTNTETDGSMVGSNVQLGTRLPVRLPQRGHGRDPWLCYVGEYNDTGDVEYKRQDMVDDGDGSFYLCIADTGEAPNSVPPAALDDTDYWMPIGGGGGLTLRLYEVAIVTFNYLTCYRLDSDGERETTDGQPDIHRVAMPRHLRLSVWENTTEDGWTLAKLFPTSAEPQERIRTCVSATGFPVGTVAKEEISPRYHAAGGVTRGDYIYGTTFATGVEFATGQECPILDMNFDARGWEFPMARVKACVNGVSIDNAVLRIGIPPT